MKLTIAPNDQLRRGAAFTLVEALMASTVLMLVIAAVMSFNMWGLAMATRSQIWLSAGDDSRNAMRMLHQDIRTASTIFVGSGNLSGFTNAGPSNIQAGNALLLYPSTNVSNWIRYYWDGPSSTLFRTNYTGSAVGDFSIVSANPITNDNYIFTMEDYLGNVLSNTTPFPVISIYLSFTKLQNPQVVIAPGNPVDFYQIKTMIAPRMRP